MRIPIVSVLHPKGKESTGLRLRNSDIDYRKPCHEERSKFPCIESKRYYFPTFATTGRECVPISRQHFIEPHLFYYDPIRNLDRLQRLCACYPNTRPWVILGRQEQQG